MIISNFVLCFCATAIIFLNNADAIGLDVPGIVNVQIGQETHPYTELFCEDKPGSGPRQCRFQVNQRAFFLGPVYYPTGTDFCAHRIVCNLNGNLKVLKRVPPDGTPCRLQRPGWACYKKKCVAPADDDVEYCESSSSSIANR